MDFYFAVLLPGVCFNGFLNKEKAKIDVDKVVINLWSLNLIIPSFRLQKQKTK